jgi:uncharacterized protein (DUF58 family)
VTTALSSDAVAAIDDLELAARLVVEGMRAGAHPSPLRGFSAEFQQHRPYQIGDDLKYLDWKILARTDRLYSKQFRETTSMSVMIVLDTSASMAFPDGVTKFRYASIAVAALAHLIITQGDAVGLMTMSGDALSYVPSRGGRLHLRSLIAQIDRLEPRGTWDPARTITRGAELLKRRGVVLVVSDFYDDEEATHAALRLVARRGHDVAMLQVISPEEQSLGYNGDLELEDLESGERRLIDASGSAQHYGETVAAFLARCRTFAQGEGIDYTLLSTDTPPQRALREYLLRRSARVQSVHRGRQKLK